eukprot:m51a1_g10848 hypothetical protein (163) ;mRNA; r:40882-41473
MAPPTRLSATTHESTDRRAPAPLTRKPPPDEWCTLQHAARTTAPSPVTSSAASMPQGTRRSQRSSVADAPSRTHRGPRNAQSDAAIDAPRPVALNSTHESAQPCARPQRQPVSVRVAPGWTLSAGRSADDGANAIVVVDAPSPAIVMSRSQTREPQTRQKRD